MHPPSSSFMRKYRVLVLAIGAFFVLNVSVYSTNFLLLRQVAIDAAKINGSGQLRGYSQQLAKSLLSLQQEMAAGEPLQTSQAQISESFLRFQQALSETRLLAAEGDDALEGELLDKLEKQWRPLHSAVSSLLQQTAPATEERPAQPLLADVQIALTLSNTRNVRLLQLADDLTRQQEKLAALRAQVLRVVQSGAMALALLNFLFIVVHMARSLRRSEQKAEQARQETADILGTVRDGLFLIDRAGTVGSQRSAQLGKVFPQAGPVGANFLALLHEMVAADSRQAARDYIDLLFNQKVKPALLAGLNPLQRVQVGGLDGARARHLCFHFHPVRSIDASVIAALLVTVTDISQEVRLEHELAGAEERARSEVALLLGVLDNDPAEVDGFLAATNHRLQGLNADLRVIEADAAAYGALLHKVFRVIHSLKGEAAALALGTVAAQAHAFEDVLSALRQQPSLRGDDLIPVATGIGQLLQELATVGQVISKLAAYARPPLPQGANAPADAVALNSPAAAQDGVYAALHRIQHLALSVAADLNKKVRVETSLLRVGELPEPMHRLLREGLPQLVRNAVVHGIESAEERRLAGKREEGQVRIELHRVADGGLELTVADDGRGVDVHILRRQLVASGRRSADAVAGMSDQEVVATLFEPGFSTASEVTPHAGRGVGLDVLNALLRETGARLNIASTPKVFTRFTLKWSPL